MRRKHLFLAIAALLATGGLWLARSPRTARDPALEKPNTAAALANPADAEPEQVLDSPRQLAPPDPARRFREFTPEQRVEFARKGHGPGG